MAESNPILCFQHCTDVNILTLELPRNCPICGHHLTTTPLRIPPFRLPSPFGHSYDNPYSVVIQPTKGTFLRDYGNESNLHIGISDGKGVILHFKENGINRDLDGWTQCLSVKMIQDNENHLEPLWSSKLQEFIAYDCWQPDRYREVGNNCYDFVLNFLKLLNFQEKHQSIRSRREFCDDLIVPQTIAAAKYISLYRRILKDKIIVQYAENTTQL